MSKDKIVGRVVFRFLLIELKVSNTVALKLSYAVDNGYNILPLDLWEVLNNDRNALVIDVRTDVEWKEVGYPDLNSLSQNLIKNSLFLAPDYEVNHDFLSIIQEVLDKSENKEELNLFFLCRSGKRSEIARDLVKDKLGFENAYNILGGFEGDSNNRELVGWVGSKLPYIIN